MSRLAIRGHATRGKEVIEILEMLGGRNANEYKGYSNLLYYYINEDGIIDCDKDKEISFPCIRFTLEEFIEKYPYKVGDKVNYVKYNDEYSSVYTIQGMRWTGITIEYLLNSSGFSALTKDLQPYKEETMEDKSNLLQQLKEYFDNTPRDVIEKEWHEYDKYNEIGPSVEEYLEYVNSTRQPQYPSTVKECCEVLGILNHARNGVAGYMSGQIWALQKLLICRNAYWKLYGEQMSLSKPWEPDWNDENEIYYTISYDGINIKCYNNTDIYSKFAFPTEEMRDAFYNNFKELIEQCKELL